MRKSILTLLGVFTILSVSAQDYRYTNTIFNNVTITENVVYTNAAQINAGIFLTFHDESNTTNVDLKMDIHQPAEDTFTNRPAIIFIHGGAFISGNKSHDDMKAFCDTFSLKGYVTATIQYRLGMNILNNASPTRAVYRGLQDGRAAVRFLRENAATYGIDPNRIYMVGSSAGGFIALQDIYMDEPSEKPVDAGTYQYNDPTDFLPPFNQITAPDLGAYDIGNFLDKNGKPDAVISLWGAIEHPDLITTENNTPVLLIHGTTDIIVPFSIGYPFNVPIFPPTYGSNEINNKLNDLNFTNKETYFVTGEGHEFYGVFNGMWTGGTEGNAYWDTIVNKTSKFFYQQHKPLAIYTHAENNLEVTFTNTSVGTDSWFWDFGDTNTSTDENPVHTYSSAGTYNVKLYVENSINSWDTISYNITVTAALYTTTFNISDGTNALQDANIEINSQNLTTDENGTASIDLEDGNYPYTVSANGYDDETSSIVVYGATQTVNITLVETAVPTYTTTFNVSDGTNALQDANIEINSQNLTTDENGTASIDLEDENYPYTVSANGYDDKTDTVVVNGATQTVSVTMTITTRITNTVKKPFKIYPNPTKEKLHIDIENTEEHRLHIIDITGKIIFNQITLENKTVIDVSDFNEGIYLLILRNNNKIYTEKLIIE